MKNLWNFLEYVFARATFVLDTITVFLRLHLDSCPCVILSRQWNKESSQKESNHSLENIDGGEMLGNVSEVELRHWTFS